MWPRKTSFLLLVLGLTAAPALAKDLPGATRWSGEVILSEPVNVPRGASLTISSGTRVVPQSTGAVIIISGRLLIEGTESAPVFFASPPGWQGIQFNDGDAGSRIRHARFARAATGIISNATSFTITNTEFHGCEFAVKLAREAHPLIENCWFVDNGIAIDSEMKSGPTIRNNRFSGNTRSAIVASHASKGTISGNRFVENQQGIALVQRYDGRIADNLFSANETAIFCNQTQKTPQIELNYFEENRVAITNTSFSQPAISKNQFIGNDTAIYNDQYGSGRVENNMFRGNGTAIYSNRKSSPEIYLNRFEGNRLALFCDYASYPVVKRNNFNGNTMGVKLGLYQSVDWERRYGSKQLVQREALTRNSNSPALINPPADVAAILDVSRNWWGKDTAQLEAVGERGNLAMIYDGYDMPEVTYEGYGPESYVLDRVRFAPWLREAVPEAGFRERQREPGVPNNNR